MGLFKLTYGLKQVEKPMVVYNQNYVSNHDRCHGQDRDGVENIIKGVCPILLRSIYLQCDTSTKKIVSVP